MVDVILMHILDIILMRILYVIIRMHILDVLLLLLAATVIAPLFFEFQPQSNNAAGSAVVHKTTALSLTTLLKHKYEIAMGAAGGPSGPAREGTSQDRAMQEAH